MKNIIRILAAVILFGTSTGAIALPATPPLEITEQTPIVFSEKKHFAVFEDSSAQMKLDELLSQTSGFQDPSALPAIHSYSHYWIVQRIRNHLDRDYQLRVDPTGWENIDSYVIDESGKAVRLKPTGHYRVSYNFLVDVNPYLPGSANTPSQFTLYTLTKDQEITLITRVKSSGNLPAKSFSMNLFNHVKFLEVRRYGMYLEGALLGILMALTIFGWFSAYNNKDRASLAYSVWMLTAFMQILSNYMPEGPRLSEFFANVEDIRFRHHYVYWPVFVLFAYGQAIFYAVFAATFLNVKKHAPWLYKLTVFYVAVYLGHYVLTSFVHHNIPQKMLWLSLGILTFILLTSFFGVAFMRYRQGHSAARFFMFAIVPYLIFRSIFILGLAGVPSPFSLMEPVGIGFLMQNTNTAQAIGLCCEAIIMALAVISRTRWLQVQLAHNMEEQKSLVENQNRVLEATVAERTRELAEQHSELDKTHQLVVSSVNYASRLQRGQLPRRHRLDGRFRSVASIWEPRDTIGGDLWWASSSQFQDKFSLAVADCTGHGVPGAMLSLLVSNSLERIYSGDPDIDPSRALMSLDHLVRVGLNQDAPDSESDDGCDAAIVEINLQSRLLRFAGAKIGLFQLTTEGTVLRHLASRASLGYQNPPDPEDEPSDLPISFKSGDVFVIVTDGFTDQVGGDRVQPTSYGYRRLEKVLESTTDRDAKDIARRMWEDFQAWQGSQMRRDDVTAVVFVMQ
jgi:serine phosphatase RsbU (regulator of sigma subunit)